MTYVTGPYLHITPPAEKEAPTIKLTAREYSKLFEDAQAARDRALEDAANIAETITTSQRIAHDMNMGVFPTQSDLRDAIAAEIRAMKVGDGK